MTAPTVTTDELRSFAPGPFARMDADDPRIPDAIKALVRAAADQTRPEHP